MSKISSGILAYKIKGDKILVFLVHPGGPFWKNKDKHAWSIPKGEPEPGEDLLQTAIREFEEETGIRLSNGDFIPLKPVKQKGGKTVYAWAVPADFDAAQIKSNFFEMEWPPHSGKKQSFPEIDKGAWFDLHEAREKINPAQRAFIEELKEKISESR